MGPVRDHCSFVLLAEFDIARGAELIHQHPQPLVLGSDLDGEPYIVADLMLPDGLEMHDEDWTTFFLNQTAFNRITPITDGADAGDRDLLYVLNIVRTKRDKIYRKLVVTKAMAIVTRHPFIHIFKPILRMALDDYFTNPSPKCLVQLFDAINSTDLSLAPTLTQDAKLLVPVDGSERADICEETQSRKYAQFYSATIAYKDHSFPLEIPLALFPEEAGDCSLTRLIQTFANAAIAGPQHPHLHTNGSWTHPIRLLFNALITKKRVLFLGYRRRTEEICSHVLAACALGSGCGAFSRGFVSRAFPYAVLLNLDEWGKVPGFIAGVTNPIFEYVAPWDLLCDISTGRMVVHKDIHNSYPAGSNPFEGGGASAGTFGDEASIVKENADRNADRIFVEDIVSMTSLPPSERLIRARVDNIQQFFRSTATQSQLHTEQTDGSS